MSADGIILAAGLSERLGAFKPALELAGKPLLQHCIDSLRPVCARIVIVSGFNCAAISPLVPDSESGYLTIIHNPDYRLGMFSSVCCGLQAVTAERFWILPGDQPLVRTETMQQMLTVRAEIVLPRYSGKKGHPVLIDSRLIPDMLILPRTAVLRDFIHSREVRVVDVADPGILLDIDTPADYQKIKALIEGGGQ